MFEIAGSSPVAPAKSWTSGHSYRPNPPIWIRCAMPTCQDKSGTVFEFWITSGSRTWGELGSAGPECAFIRAWFTA